MTSSTSPHSSPSSDKAEQTHISPTTSRPKPHTALTVIPTIPTPDSLQATRARSLTNSDHPSASPGARRRAETTPQSRPTPLKLHTLPEVPSDRCSSPIPIPPRQKDRSRPTTPLTARGTPINYFGFQHTAVPRPHISQSLTPYYTTGAGKNFSSQPAEGVPIVQRGFTAMGPGPGSPLYEYTPTSPLSPPMPTQSFPSPSRPNPRRPVQNMNLSGLPKFHPANFPSKDSNSATSSPRSPRSVTSQPRLGRGSDARQKLHQYQREVIASATRSSRSLLSEGLGPKPSPPRLAPLRSPIAPMTPLVLESQIDYMLGGSSLLPSGSEDGDGREMVERLVRRENERRKHPEARSGSVSPALSPALSPASSPAVSPAGGRG